MFYDQNVSTRLVGNLLWFQIFHQTFLLSCLTSDFSWYIFRAAGRQILINSEHQPPPTILPTNYPQPASGGD